MEGGDGGNGGNGRAQGWTEGHIVALAFSQALRSLDGFGLVASAAPSYRVTTTRPLGCPSQPPRRDQPPTTTPPPAPHSNSNHHHGPFTNSSAGHQARPQPFSLPLPCSLPRTQPHSSARPRNHNCSLDCPFPHLQRRTATHRAPTVTSRSHWRPAAGPQLPSPNRWPSSRWIPSENGDNGGKLDSVISCRRCNHFLKPRATMTGRPKEVAHLFIRVKHLPPLWEWPRPPQVPLWHWPVHGEEGWARSAYRATSYRIAICCPHRLGPP
jgi:hypothetical protein